MMHLNGFKNEDSWARNSFYCGRIETGEGFRPHYIMVSRNGMEKAPLKIFFAKF